MKVFTYISIAIGALICSTQADAAILSPEQALSRARNTQGVRRAHALNNQGAPQLVYTVEQNSTPAVYVFSNAPALTTMSTNGTESDGQGFIVVSADDVAPAVLGYSDIGSFNAATMPPAMKYWLDEYARQIEYARTMGAPAYKAPASDSRAPISPLVATRWNQSTPFNNMCPTYEGSRCVTGCVATALAQVMKYHNYPPKGQSSHSYVWSVGSTSETLSIDYANTTYDWDNMLDVYTSSASVAQTDAVANLMYSCGVAVNMSYTPNESGASSFKVPTALVDYFGYDKGVRYAERNYFSIDEWEDMIYANLADPELGPVQYSGQSNDGGHSFVCDGYSSDGYFHINWGWGGMSDGYFLLTALNPESQGIGGSTSGYNFSQDVILGVRLPSEGSEIYQNLLFNGGFSIQQSSAQLGSDVTVASSTGSYPCIYNYSIGAVSGTLGLKIVSETNPDVVVYATGTPYTDLGSLYGIMTYTATLPQDLADGTYTVTPALCTASGTWQDIPVQMSKSRFSTMTVADGTATFTAEPSATVTVTDTNFATPFYIGKDFEITGTLVNNTESEYYGYIAAALVEGSQIIVLGDEYPVDLEAGESTPMDYISAFNSTNSNTLEPGNYTLVFIDMSSYRAVSDMYTINLQQAPATTTVSVSNLEIANQMSRINPEQTLTFTADVTCTAGYFAGTLTLAIFPETGGSSLAAFPSNTVFINEGETMPVDFSGTFSQGVPGTRYMAAVFNGSQQATGAIYFIMQDVTGVDDSYMQAEEPMTVTIYSVDGIMVYSGATKDGVNLAPGHYIVRNTYAGGATDTSHIMVK